MHRGDAALVFADCVARWELFPYQGFTAEDFTATLAQPAADEPQARELAAGVLRLLQAQFKLKADARAPIFISYAHEDQTWLLRLRSALRPLEHRAQLAVWDDHRLQAGDVYKDRIVEAIARAPVAIFIVSSAFFASTFIHTEELARLLEKNKQGTCRLLWLLVDGEE